MQFNGITSQANVHTGCMYAACIIEAVIKGHTNQISHAYIWLNFVPEGVLGIHASGRTKIQCVPEGVQESVHRLLCTISRHISVCVSVCVCFLQCICFICTSHFTLQTQRGSSLGLDCVIKASLFLCLSALFPHTVHYILQFSNTIIVLAVVLPLWHGHLIRTQLGSYHSILMLVGLLTAEDFQKLIAQYIDLVCIHYSLL